jgi:hypothetical protein
MLVTILYKNMNYDEYEFHWFGKLGNKGIRSMFVVQFM